MSNSIDFPRQCQVYLSRRTAHDAEMNSASVSSALKQSGNTKKRPVVVVSIDIRNQYSSTVLVVPFSSDLNDGANNPSRTVVLKDEGGLEVDSVAMCDVLTTIEKRYLERGPYGEITASSLQKIQRAIQIAIGAF